MFCIAQLHAKSIVMHFTCVNEKKIQVFQTDASNSSMNKSLTYAKLFKFFLCPMNILVLAQSLFFCFMFFLLNIHSSSCILNFSTFCRLLLLRSCNHIWHRFLECFSNQFKTKFWKLFIYFNLTTLKFIYFHSACHILSYVMPKPWVFWHDSFLWIQLSFWSCEWSALNFKMSVWFWSHQISLPPLKCCQLDVMHSHLTLE